MSESSGKNNFLPLQKEGESDFVQAPSTDVSEGKMKGGEALEEIQKDESSEGGADQYSGNGKEYPLPSEQAEREREAKESSES